LQNSSFELGNPQKPSEITLPWRYWGTTVTQRTYEYAHTGTYSLVTSGVDQAAGPYQYTGAITPGKYKAVLYYYLPTSATTSGSIQLWTNILQSGGGKITDVRTGNVPFSWAKGQWRKLDYIFEVKPDYNGGVAPAQLQVCVTIRDFKTTDRLYIDDFSLYKLAD